jgi:hypothetical protein
VNRELSLVDLLLAKPWPHTIHHRLDPLLTLNEPAVVVRIAMAFGAAHPAK